MAHEGLEYAGYKNFQSDEDQDAATKDVGFTGKQSSELFTQQYTDKADDEGDSGDEQGAYKRHKPVIIRDCKTNGQRIDGGRDSLYHQ